MNHSKIQRIYKRLSILTLLTLGLSVSAFASDPITVISNLSSFIFGLIKAVGIILVGWGVVQVGLSIQSHDASQRSKGFLTRVGGFVVFFAREVLPRVGVAERKGGVQKNRPRR